MNVQGIVAKETLKKLWGDSHFEALLKVFQHFDVLVDFPRDTAKVIIPCLLSNAKPKTADERWQKEAKDSTIVGRLYKFPFKPFGVFNSLFLKFCDITNSSVEFWLNGLIVVLRETVMLLSLDEEGTTFTSGFSLKVLLVGPTAAGKLGVSKCYYLIQFRSPSNS